MRLADFRDRIERDLEFPAERHAVIQTLGGLEIDAPYGNAETVEEILGRTGDDVFQSTDDVYLGVLGCLSDSYIGRKYYDDRGLNLAVDHRSF